MSFSKCDWSACSWLWAPAITIRAAIPGASSFLVGSWLGQSTPLLETGEESFLPRPNSRVKTDEHGYRSFNHIVWHTDICAFTAVIRLNSVHFELETRLKPGVL